MMIQAVIFDLDGTITKPWFDFDKIRAEMGLSQADGPIWEAMLRMSPQQRDKAQEILDHYEDLGVEESQLNVGAKETLGFLRQNDINIGILTRNKAENARAVMVKHEAPFDGIIGREDGPVKPDSFGVVELCRRFDADVKYSMMVGDYLFDIQCGNAAGAVTVLLASQENADEFAEFANYRIETLDEIMDIIQLNHT